MTIEELRSLMRIPADASKETIIPNRSLGPISSGDVKVLSCSPESKECLPLIYPKTVVRLNWVKTFQPVSRKQTFNDLLLVVFNPVKHPMIFQSMS